MDSLFINNVNEKLIKWYKEYKRDFPWRKTKTTLYEIFIAEILLRKTNAEMVSKFFPIFIKKYPTFKSIKETSETELEKDLEPLGLFKIRSRLIKSLTVEIENKFNGKIPDQYDLLIQLNGIGKYIANAILCFGYNQKTILVDTNINRIFSRVLNIEYPKKINDSHPLWQDLENYILFEDRRAFFMALIDFGALICKKKNYDCRLCPIFEICEYKKKILK